MVSKLNSEFLQMNGWMALVYSFLSVSRKEQQILIHALLLLLLWTDSNKYQTK